MSVIGPRLEDLDADGFAACIETLGDTISYKPSGDSWRDLSAYVDYGEQMRDIGSGQVVEQDITVELLIASARAKPAGATRVRLSRISGKTFRPINVRVSKDGAHWLFELEKVNA